MAFNVKSLTNKGRNLQAKAQAGAELKYTKFVFGDGLLGNQSIALLNNVISPKKNVTVTRVFVVPSDQRANVGMYFTNADVTTPFIWREIGLYALDPDEGEILYWYGYDSNGTEIPAGGSSEILEQTFDTLVFVGTATNISSTVDQSLVFATTAQMNQVLADSKAYTDTKFENATIPDASLTVKGKVQLSNNTESTSQTHAATSKAVNDARQAAIAAAGVRDDEVVLPAALLAAQTYVNNRPWQKFALTQDNGSVKPLAAQYNLNDLTTPGFYYVGSPTNSPGNENNGYYVEVFSTSTSVSSVIQRVTDYVSGKTFLRLRSGTTWRQWVLQTPTKNIWGSV